MQSFLKLKRFRELVQVMPKYGDNNNGTNEERKILKRPIEKLLGMSGRVNMKFVLCGLLESSESWSKHAPCL